MGRTTCTEFQCLYKGDLYLFHFPLHLYELDVLYFLLTHNSERVTQICVFNTVKLGTSASSP